MNDWTIIEERSQSDWTITGGHSRYECFYLFWHWATGKVNHCKHPTRDGKKCLPEECPLRKEIIGSRKTERRQRNKMQEIASIIIHCTASEWGCAREVDNWHRAKGWRSGGYHFVIQNGFPTFSHLQGNTRLSSLDGHIECGRYLNEDPYIESDEVGAHALGYNRKSIGIALVGDEKFTNKQMSSLTNLVKELCQLKGVKYSQVLGHYEVNPAKNCPNFDMEKFRKLLSEDIPSVY